MRTVNKFSSFLYFTFNSILCSYLYIILISYMILISHLYGVRYLCMIVDIYFTIINYKATTKNKLIFISQKIIWLVKHNYNIKIKLNMLNVFKNYFVMACFKQSLFVFVYPNACKMYFQLLYTPVGQVKSILLLNK